MIADALKQLRNGMNPAVAVERPLYGKLVSPTVPHWSYPHHETTIAANDAVTHRSTQACAVRLARLPGLNPDVLRPMRAGHDDIGGQIACFGIVMFSIFLVLLNFIR